MTKHLLQPKQKTRQRILNILILALLPFHLIAQTNPSVTGTVKTEKGESLESITVEARNKRTDSAYTTLSDSKGSFRFGSIPSGNYVFTFLYLRFLLLAMRIRYSPAIL
jgi:hypothetical protein